MQTVVLNEPSGPQTELDAQSIKTSQGCLEQLGTLAAARSLDRSGVGCEESQAQRAGAASLWRAPDAQPEPDSSCTAPRQRLAGWGLARPLCLPPCELRV